MLFVFGLFLNSCGEDTAAAEQAALESARAAQQTAYDAMMEGHDRVMPLMGKITAAQRTIMEQLKGDEAMDPSKKEVLEAASEQLEDANDGMMVWMQNLKPLDELRENMDNEAIITYIKQEAAKIAKVEISMNAAIGAAAEVVEEAAGHSHDGDGHDHSH
jgi:hypothetical protein